MQTFESEIAIGAYTAAVDGVRRQRERGVLAPIADISSLNSLIILGRPGVEEFEANTVDVNPGGLLDRGCGILVEQWLRQHPQSPIGLELEDRGLDASLGSHVFFLNLVRRFGDGRKLLQFTAGIESLR